MLARKMCPEFGGGEGTNLISTQRKKQHLKKNTIFIHSINCCPKVVKNKLFQRKKYDTFAWNCEKVLMGTLLTCMENLYFLLSSLASKDCMHVVPMLKIQMSRMSPVVKKPPPTNLLMAKKTPTQVFFYSLFAFPKIGFLLAILKYFQKVLAQKLECTRYFGSWSKVIAFPVFAIGFSGKNSLKSSR